MFDLIPFQSFFLVRFGHSYCTDFIDGSQELGMAIGYLLILFTLFMYLVLAGIERTIYVADQVIAKGEERYLQEH